MALRLLNNTPFVGQLLPMLEKNGANILRVVLKASYRIERDGRLRPHDQQQELVMADEYWGELGRSSLRYESDVCLFKPRTDFLILGEAIPYRGRRVQEMEVAVWYQGRSLKRLRVTGDRRWQKRLLGWSISAPEPFERMPLLYERAFGGSDDDGCEPRNRCGVGYTTRADRAFDGAALPNLELPDQLISAPTDRPVPAGVGPVARSWEPRLSWGGTYDESWLEDRFPLLPLDFDARFNQCAPMDQWIDRPRGGECVAVEGMTFEGSMAFELPPCQVRLLLRYVDRIEERPFDLDTVLVEPGERRLVLTWRGTADTHGDPFRLRELIVGEQNGKSREHEFDV